MYSRNTLMPLFETGLRLYYYSVSSMTPDIGSFTTFIPTCKDGCLDPDLSAVKKTKKTKK